MVKRLTTPKPASLATISLHDLKHAYTWTVRQKGNCFQHKKVKTARVVPKIKEGGLVFITTGNVGDPPPLPGMADPELLGALVVKERTPFLVRGVMCGDPEKKEVSVMLQTVAIADSPAAVKVAKSLLAQHRQQPQGPESHDEQGADDVVAGVTQEH